MAWDKTRCEEGILAPDLNNAIRANYEALETDINREHQFSTGGTPADQIIHRQGSARCFYQATAPATRISGDAFDSTDNGSLWVDSDNNKPYLLTDYSVPTWTSIESLTIATLLAASRTFAEVITFSKAAVFSVSPTFTLGIVGNNSFLQGRNAAGDGNVDLIKINTSDKPQIPDGARLASNAAPTAEAQIANKKYVDDQDAADHPAYSGGESHTDGSGLIIKMGKTATASANSKTVTFGTPFPNGVISASANCDTASVREGINITTFNKTTLVMNRQGTAVSQAYYWKAIGY